MAKCYPLPRIRTLSQGLAPSLPFSRDVLSQGMPFLKGLWQLTLLQGFYPFARIGAGTFPFPKGCPKSSRAKVAVPFCKGFPFALRSILSQGLILAISLLQGTSFLKDCLWQTPFFKGHPFSRASLGNCPFARAILLQGLCARVSLSQGASFAKDQLHSSLFQGVSFVKDHCFPFSRDGSFPFLKGHPLCSIHPFAKGALSQGSFLAAIPFPRGAPFPRNYPFARIQRPNFIIVVQLMWGTLSICFVLQDSFARVSRNTWTRAESSLFCNKAKFSCPYLWNCPLITLGHRKACDLIVAIQCSWWVRNLAKPKLIWGCTTGNPWATGFSQSAKYVKPSLFFLWIKQLWSKEKLAPPTFCSHLPW